MRNLITILLLTFFPILASAQSYDQLWKDVKSAQNKDLPKTEITALDKIVAKAKKENNYGQLLAAGLQRGSAQVEIAPDSLKNEVSRLETDASASKNPALKAVYYAILGDIYKNSNGLGDDHETRGKDYWQKSMANPEVLAKAQAKDYEPVVGKGVDSRIFNDDLLHVIGSLTGDWSALNKYYEKAGNRRAACLSALYSVADPHRVGDGDYDSQLDSLISKYGDLDVCAEVAIRRYKHMDARTNEGARKKYEYGEQILNRWPNWQNISEVSNEQLRQTQPMFNCDGEESTSVPDKAKTIKFEARNISKITLTLTRLNINGDTELNPSTNLKDLENAKIPSTAVVVTKNMTFEHSYDILKDSIIVPKLPVGMWLMEFSFENDGSIAKTNKPEPLYNLYHVSNVMYITESLPDDKIRYVVVNATTGKPIAGAHLRLKQTRNYRQSPIVTNLTTDANGEAVFNSKDGNSINAWAYTDDDKAAPDGGQWYGYYSREKSNVEDISLFTDRSIYRPGQTVHVNLIDYKQNNTNYTRKANADRNITLTLDDANGKELEKTTVTTDKYGSASYDFALPSSGLTGQFSISAQSNSASGWASFNVEEYKRPTFEVTFDDYKEAYKAGDTITVTGHAKSYAGVPVQNAKVEYTVSRRNAWWWRWYNSSNEDFSLTDTVSTDEDGNFKARVPMTLPSDDVKALEKGEKLYHYYNMCVDAKVTDVSGESHEGDLRLPLGTNPTALTCDLPDKVLKDSLRTIKFTRTNMAGKEIEGTVKWKVEPQSTTAYHQTPTTSPNPSEGGESKLDLWHESPANKVINLPSFGGEVEGSKSSGGLSVLTAICGTDTLRKEFVVFSVNDKRPVVTTHDWFWQSAGQFPRDGKPVYVQFGSSDADQHFVYTLISGNDKVLEQGSVDKSNELTTREFKYKEEYGDGLVFNLSWVRDGIVYSYRAEIKRPMKDNQLRLSWKTFRNLLVPGQKEEWTLTVLNPDGKPADAQLMAVLYDKSLDQIKKNEWNFSPNFYISLPSANWIPLRYGSLRGWANGRIALDNTHPLSLRFINRDYYYELMMGGSSRVFYSYGSYDLNEVQNLGGRKMRKLSRSNVMLAAAPMAKKEMVADSVSEENMMESAMDEVAYKESSSSQDNEEKGTAQVRENLNETAFFYPQLTTDKSGYVSLKFTLPEAVTTWRFMGLAHDADINYGLLTDEVVAKKTVMVQPNMPRFIRQGDKGQISTRIFNTSAKPVSGKVCMEILDPMTEKVLSTQETTFSADSNSTASATFPIDFSQSLGNQKSPLGGDLEGTLYIVRIIASGDGFSDGEQHYLAVLPNSEFVTNTYPFTQVGKGTKNVDLGTLVPKGVKDAKVKFEYANNPNWLMIQALPYVANTNDKDAISLVTAYFANSVARNIMNSDPKIKKVFNSLLLKEGRGGSSLLSNLEKNQELKSLVLSETPWVADADNELEQMRMLSNYFDENSINNKLSTTFKQLKNLQNPDGSFSWWPGMDGSFYVTLFVTKTLVRLGSTPALLKKEGGLTGSEDSQASEQINSLLSKEGRGGSSTWSYLDSEVAKQVAEMKRLEAKKIKVWPSDELCDYVYSCALAKRKSTPDINYIVDLLAKMPRDLTIYGKANSAVILAMYGKKKVANEYLQSINEYSVYKEEMGRYFDTHKALYSWFDYKIPTQTAAIEACKLLKPNDTQTITEMQRWLLQEKRTQVWDTPLNSVNAIYAFLGKPSNQTTSQTTSPNPSEGGEQENRPVAESSLDEREASKLYVDGKEIALPKGTAGLGYVKADISEELRVKSEESNSYSSDAQTSIPSVPSTLSVEKTSDGVSWGAVYAQFFQPSEEIMNQSSGLTVKRELLDSKGNLLLPSFGGGGGGRSALGLGTKVRVRITITADRDYDFVQVVDKRAACLEPVNQLSGYHWGYYLSPRDCSTNYYFDRMAKGTHVVETEYYIDRAGDYTSGTCTVQCAYSPEFKGREHGKKISVGE